jgi:hypothetical protein
VSGPSRRRWWRVVAAVVVLSVGLSACGGIVGSFLDTRQGLSRAGFSHISVGFAGGDDVTVSARVDQDASAAEIDEIAAVVWRDVHERFGDLRITLHAADGTVSRTIGFAELQQELGARDPADNRTSIHTGVIHVGLAVVAGLVVVALLIVVVVVLVVRRRGRRRGTGPPPGAGTGGPGGWWSPGQGRPVGPGTSWGAPVPRPAEAPGSADPWRRPPGSGPPAW